MIYGVKINIFAHSYSVCTFGHCLLSYILFIYFLGINQQYRKSAFSQGLVLFSLGDGTFFLDALRLLNVLSYFFANGCFDDLLSYDTLKYQQSAKTTSTLISVCK